MCQNLNTEKPNRITIILLYNNISISNILKSYGLYLIMSFVIDG